MADAPSPPPNLRVASDESKDCANCTFYARGKCTKYSNLPVDGEWLCDSWAKEGSEKGSDTPSGDTPTDEQARTTRDAGVRVRAHFRRSRAVAAKQ